MGFKMLQTKRIRDLSLLPPCKSNFKQHIMSFISIYGTNYWVDHVKFVEDSLYKIGRDMVYLSRPYPFKFFKDCLQQILLGPLLNTLFHINSCLENPSEHSIGFIVPDFSDQWCK